MNASRARLVAAFREGFGLAAIAVIDGPDGVRIAAAAPGAEITCAPAETVHCRWWCPRAFEAASIATAVAARLHNRETCAGTALSAGQAIVRAAKQRNVDLYSDEKILDQTTAAIARIDDELERLRQSGDLRPVNKSYQSYRCEAAAKGERVLPYTFAAADAGAAVLISYGFIPAAINNACIEWVAERYRYRTRVGQSAQTVQGQQTASYSLKDIPDFVRASLDPYRSVVGA